MSPEQRFVMVGECSVRAKAVVQQMLVCLSSVDEKERGGDARHVSDDGAVASWKYVLCSSQISR